MRLRKGEKVVLVEEYSHFPFFPKGTTATVDMDEDNGHLVWIRSPLSSYAVTCCEDYRRRGDSQ